MRLRKTQTNQSQKYLVCWCDRSKKSALVMHFGKLQTIKAKNTLCADVKDPLNELWHKLFWVMRLGKKPQ